MTWSKDLIENITDIGELEAKLRFDRRLTQQMRALCEKIPDVRHKILFVTY